MALPSNLQPLVAGLDRLIRLLENVNRVAVATGAGPDRLVDSSQAWDENIWAGDEVQILDGAGAGQVRVVRENDRTSLKVADPWDVEPAQGSVYRLQPSERPVTRVSLIRQDITAALPIQQVGTLKAQRATRFRIMASLSASGVLSVIYTRQGTSQTRQLNSGAALVANSLYVFDVLADAGDEVALQYSVAATFQLLTIHEIARGNA